MSLTEEAVGMAPVQAQVIECVFRERYSDFVVREVGPDGRHLEDDDGADAEARGEAEGGEAGELLEVAQPVDRERERDAAGDEPLQLDGR